MKTKINLISKYPKKNCRTEIDLKCFPTAGRIYCYDKRKSIHSMPFFLISIDHFLSLISRPFQVKMVCEVRD